MRYFIALCSSWGAARKPPFAGQIALHFSFPQNSTQQVVFPVSSAFKVVQFFASLLRLSCLCVQHSTGRFVSAIGATPPPPVKEQKCRKP